MEAVVWKGMVMRQVVNVLGDTLVILAYMYVTLHVPCYRVALLGENM